MGIKLTKLPKLLASELSDRETLLLQLVRERDECIQELKDEVARLKGEKGKPKIKPSRLEPKEKASQPEAPAQDSPGEEKEDSQKKKKRSGSAKRNKTANLPIHETKLIQPTQEIPAGSEFKS